MLEIPESDFLSTVGQLRDKSSAKRRSAAKRLRKLALPESCSFLLDALRTEIKDVRTWETQYQMIMALGMSGCKSAIPLLSELSHLKMENTAVLTAVGDALVRLDREYLNDMGPVFRLFDIENDFCLFDGALRAVAMLRLCPEEKWIDRLLRHVTALNEPALYFWAAAACPGWSGESVDRFLGSCLLLNRDDVKQAAKAAKEKKYLKWNPL